MINRYNVQYSYIHEWSLRPTLREPPVYVSDSAGHHPAAIVADICNNRPRPFSRTFSSMMVEVDR